MKKGFTLIEVIASVTILAIIFALAFPPILNQLKNNQDKIDEVTLKIFYEASNNYIDQYNSDYPIKNGNIYCISLQTLIDNDNLKEPLTDSSGKKIDLSKVIKIEIDNTNAVEHSLVFSDKCTTKK